MTILYEVVYETFVKSYPNTDKEQIEQFVSQNLLNLVEPIIEVNLGKQTQV